MSDLTETCKSVARHWELTIKKIRDDFPIAGSPERCRSRVVIEDDRNHLFILEDISPQNVARKEEIAKTLSTLSENGIQAVHPYLLNAATSFITKHENRYWILKPYIDGVPMERPAYVHDGWRGRTMAAFLIELKERSHGIPVDDGRRPFSITAFIADLLKRMEKHNRELLPEIAPVIDYLDREFFAIHDRLPIRFCHGDYHPLNIIWSKDSILSVIDWEFSGNKPEIYDMALLMGCLGMEDPAALTGPLIQELLHGLAHAYTPVSLQYLFEYIVAIRFAWLSEWLRNADQEMITLEIDYMTLLILEQRRLKDAWFRWQSRLPIKP